MVTKRSRRGKASSRCHWGPGVPLSAPISLATSFTERLECTAEVLRDMETDPAPGFKPRQGEMPKDKIRHEWYQNSTHVYFTLLAKRVAKDKAQIDIQPRLLRISLPLQSGPMFDISLDPLFAQVNSEKSIIRILPLKIEVILAKAVTDREWSSFKGTERASDIEL